MRGDNPLSKPAPWPLTQDGKPIPFNRLPTEQQVLLDRWAWQVAGEWLRWIMNIR